MQRISDLHSKFALRPHHVEEFLLRLRCSPLYINMAFGFESMGGQWRFENVGLNVSERRRIVTKFCTSVDGGKT